MNILISIAFCVLTGIATWFIGRSKLANQHTKAIDELKDQLNKNNSKIAELSTSLEHEREDNERYLNELTSLEVEFKEIQNTKVKFETEASQLDQQLQQVRDEKNGLQNTLENTQKTLNETNNAKTLLEAEVEQLKNNLSSEKDFLDNAKETLKESFQALSKESLASNNKDFLVLADNTFNEALKKLKEGIDNNENNVNNLLTPIKTSLEELSKVTNETEKNRISSLSKLDQQISNLMQNEQHLRNETLKLVNALKTPRITGDWGQMVLKRVVELSGMSEHIDFKTEVSITDDDSQRLRPDMVVYLPNDRQIVIDAKASIPNYLEAINAKDNEERNTYMEQYIKKRKKPYFEFIAKKLLEQV
jgi:DNA recombination protein RmuC